MNILLNFILFIFLILIITCVDGVKLCQIDENKFKCFEDDEIEYKKSEKAFKEVSNNNKMILFEPRAYSEAQQIADYLKGNNQLTYNKYSSEWLHELL